MRNSFGPHFVCVDIKNLLCILCDHHLQFLSMKLAAVNPRLDLSIDDLFEKEVRNIMRLQCFLCLGSVFPVLKYLI